MSTHYLYYPFLEAHEEQNYDVLHWSSFAVMSTYSGHVQSVLSFHCIHADICSGSSHIGTTDGMSFTFSHTAVPCSSTFNAKINFCLLE
jgi:hypothetical protein